MDLNSALGRIIAEERHRAELSQEALAESAGLHPTYISQLERGKKSPTVRVLVDLANALGKRASDLLKKVEAQGSNKHKKP